MATGQIIKRIGNTLSVNINLKDSKGDSINIDTKFGVQSGDTGSHAKFEIFIIKEYGRTISIPYSTIGKDNMSQGKIKFDWKAKNQYGVGDYTILLRLYTSTKGTDNKYTSELENSIDLEQAVRLTQHTCQGTSTDSSLTIDFHI